MQITDVDRDPVTGRIMVEAQQRAAARETPPEAPAPDEPTRTRTFSNRRGHADPAAPAKSYKSAIGPVAGVLAFLLLFVLGTRLLPGASPVTDRAVPTTATTPGPAGAGDDRRPTTDQPAAAPAGPTIDAYAAPDGALLGPIPADTPLTYRHSDYSEWAGVRWQGTVVWIKASAAQIAGLPDLAPPTPAPAPVVVYVEPPCDPQSNPRYTAAIDVELNGRPLGQVTGASCDSQAAAQADAEQRAAALRQAAPPPCPTWHPPLTKPECVK